MTVALLEEEVRSAVRSVTDPEYPDISIVDLGLLEQVTVQAGRVSVELIPTFSGCPALQFIASDVYAAVSAVPGVNHCEVVWLSDPVWSVDRLTVTAQVAMAQHYTVVLRRKDGSLLCPVCGSAEVIDQSMAGPTRCRSVAWCESCRNPVEVMR